MEEDDQIEEEGAWKENKTSINRKPITLFSPSELHPPENSMTAALAGLPELTKFANVAANEMW